MSIAAAPPRSTQLWYEQGPYRDDAILLGPITTGSCKPLWNVVRWVSFCISTNTKRDSPIRGHPKISTFSQVFKTYTFGGRGWEVKDYIFVRTLLTFGLIFIIFMGIFVTQKMLMCTLLVGGGGGVLRKCMVSTFVKMLTFMDSP